VGLSGCFLGDLNHLRCRGCAGYRDPARLWWTGSNRTGILIEKFSQCAACYYCALDSAPSGGWPIGAAPWVVVDLETGVQ